MSTTTTLHERPLAIINGDILKARQGFAIRSGECFLGATSPTSLLYWTRHENACPIALWPTWEEAEAAKQTYAEKLKGTDAVIEPHVRGVKALAKNRTGVKHVPIEILAALAQARGTFTEFEHVFYCIWLWGARYIGVAGDGDNGSYEYFVFEEGKLKLSDCGYGCTEIALKEIINQEVH